MAKLDNNETLLKLIDELNVPWPAAVKIWNAAAAALGAERDELQAAFDLRWKADLRAIEKWQKQTGEKLVWPDHGDLCIWLLGQLNLPKGV